MAVIRNLNATAIVAPGEIFNAEIQTEAVQMDNAQAAHFFIASGDGTSSKVVGQVMGKRDDREDFHIREFDVEIGGNATSAVVIRAREIASDDGTSVYLRIPNAERDNVPGAIFVVKTNERYSD